MGSLEHYNLALCPNPPLVRTRQVLARQSPLQLLGHQLLATTSLRGCSRIVRLLGEFISMHELEQPRSCVGRGCNLSSSFTSELGLSRCLCEQGRLSQQ